MTIRELKIDQVQTELGKKARTLREAVASVEEACVMFGDLLDLHTDNTTALAAQLYGTATPDADQVQVVDDLAAAMPELCEVVKALKGAEASSVNTSREAVIRRIARRP